MSLKSRGAALLMEMGTGKSLTAIAITGALSQAGRIRRVLIVAPLSILGVWEEEFQKFAAFPYALAVLSGSSAKKLDTLRDIIREKTGGLDKPDTGIAFAVPATFVEGLNNNK